MSFRVACFFYFIPTLRPSIQDTPCHELHEHSARILIPTSDRSTVLNLPEIIGGTVLISEEIRLNRPTALRAAQAPLGLRELAPRGFALQISARHRELAKTRIERVDQSL